MVHKGPKLADLKNPTSTKGKTIWTQYKETKARLGKPITIISAAIRDNSVVMITKSFDVQFNPTIEQYRHHGKCG